MVALGRNYLHLKAMFWLVAVVLGALQAWDARHSMNPDGISYLDIGDAYFRGDWNVAINAYWSPFYSWLLGLAMVFLKPSPYWEFSVVHLVNFIIYLFALGCFHFFLLELISYNREKKAGFSADRSADLPEWACLALGYTLFIWSSLELISISVVTPDMCVAAFVYSAAGILLRIRRGSASWLTFVLLGLVLGIGYLAKAAMFPLAFVFLGVGMFSVGNLRRAVPRVLLALVVFLLVGGPFIVALSQVKGRLTFGDSGKLNYAWHVNRADIDRVHQEGGSFDSIPRYRMERLSTAPAIYSFGTPDKITYPLWYDPSDRYRGTETHFDPRAQIRVLVSTAKNYFQIFFHLQNGLVFGFLILYFMGRRRWFCVMDMLDHSTLLIPAIAALAMYSLIFVLPRYVAPFVVLLWLGVASGVRLPDSQESRRLVASVIIAMMVTILVPILEKAYPLARNLTMIEDPSAHPHWQVADSLNRMGAQPGDKVAYIGFARLAAWARLARVQIVAEIRKDERLYFWEADSLVKSRVIKTFATTGAKIIVAEEVPNYISTNGWQAIGNTGIYVYVLPR